MRRKTKRLAACLLLFVFLSISTGAQAVTLRTVSIFAGMDAAADTYTHFLRTWEKNTGHEVVDHSAPSDEAWKTGVLRDFAAGNEPDVLFYFSCTSDSAPILSRVVPIREIREAYPELALEESPACREADGQVYAIPVRDFWEGLFVNTDVFARYGLELPTTWERFETAIQVFRDEGVVPIAISLSDVPHYLAESAILACGSPEEYCARPQKGEQVPESWVAGMELIVRLQQMGAFSDQAFVTTDDDSAQLFLDKKAAMRIDGSWFANGISQQSMDTICVLPFPAADERAQEGAYIGGVSMGFYLTRKAWNSPERREAALDLLCFLATGENAQALGGYAYRGELLASVQRLTRSQALISPPMQDAMNPQARSVWFNLIPAVAAGTLSARDMWAQVMQQNPFGG